MFIYNVYLRMVKKYENKTKEINKNSESSSFLFRNCFFTSSKFIYSCMIEIYKHIYLNLSITYKCINL